MYILIKRVPLFRLHPICCALRTCAGNVVSDVHTDLLKCELHTQNTITYRVPAAAAAA